MSFIHRSSVCPEALARAVKAVQCESEIEFRVPENGRGSVARGGQKRGFLKVLKESSECPILPQSGLIWELKRRLVHRPPEAAVERFCLPERRCGKSSHVFWYPLARAPRCPARFFFFFFQTYFKVFLFFFWPRQNFPWLCADSCRTASAPAGGTETSPLQREPWWVGANQTETPGQARPGSL